MTYKLNASGTINAANTPQQLWLANAVGALCCIQNNGVGELTVTITPSDGSIAPIKHVLLRESFIDETRMDVTAAVSVSGNVANNPFTAWRGDN